MRQKAAYYTAMAEETASIITRNQESWTSFLTTAAKFYKYPYNAQLLIHRQRPDATACAEYDFWNNRWGRYIKRGSKGIALVDYDGNNVNLRYVFDVADTEERANSRPVKLWVMQEKYYQTVQTELAKAYNIPAENGLTILFEEISRQLTAEYWKEHDIRAIADGSLLEEYDEDHLEVRFKQAVAVSVSYMLMSRCGIETKSYFQPEDFVQIYEFNTKATRDAMGIAISKISQNVLRQIEVIIKNYERERHTEKNVDLSGQVRNHIEVGLSHKELQSTGGGDPFSGTDLQLSFLSPDGGIEVENVADTSSAFSFAQSDIDQFLRYGGNTDRQRERVVAEFSKQKSTEENAAYLQSVFHGGNGITTENGSITAWYAEDGIHLSRTKSARYDHSAQIVSWESAAERIGQLLDEGGFATNVELAAALADLDLPRKSFETQITELPAAKFFITEDEIDAALSGGSGFTGGKSRIYPFFLENHTTKEKADFLRQEYGIGGHSDALSGFSGSWEAHDSRGERFQKEGCPDVILTWEKVTSRITDLIHKDRYLTAEEQRAYEKTQAEKNLAEVEEDQNRIEQPVPSGEVALTLRENLAERGIVNGQVVDMEKLDADPFIQQVMHDTERISAENVKSADIQSENYHITDTHLGEGGAKAKFEANLQAIQLLKELEVTDQQATPDQQRVLSRYVGWGGLADAFDPDKSAWSKEYQALKEVLTPSEYEAARASTLNAYYTSPTVIKAMYEAVGNMGFKTGNILEPSCGVGNFFGMLPEQMQESHLYGVELDSISGRIAKQLYPKADITVAGFETTNRQDFFDLAIGNVPFGNYQVADKPYDKLGFSIHNYFFAKSIDQVRPGGVIAFVTSRFTMDSKNIDARRYIAQRAELLGAIRLPNDAFKKNAGTEVVSDIIFLQKRDQVVDVIPDWVYLNTTDDGYTMNNYFVEHPEMVLGELATESTQYGKDDLTVRPYGDLPLAEQLKEAIQRIDGSYRADRSIDFAEESQDTYRRKEILPDPAVKNYSYTVIDGEIYYRENDQMVRQEINSTAKERIKGMIALRDCTRQLIAYQLEDYSEEDIRGLQQRLNEIYDSFSRQYGRISDRANHTAFHLDNSYYLLTSLEVTDSDGKFVRKADMFSKRTIKQKQIVTSVGTASEALIVSLAEKVKVDLPYMAELTGKSEKALVGELRGVIFQLPSSGEYVTADEYLSGNVREKLREAKQAAETDPAYQANVSALEAVQPVDLTPGEISVRLGATWIPTGDVQQFMFELFDTPNYARWNIKVHYSKVTGTWNIEGKSQDRSSIKARSTYGTQRINGYKIIEETLNLKDVRIFDYIEDEEGRRTAVLNKKETAIAQAKQELIKQAFVDWIWKDPERRNRLCTQYNEQYNSVRSRQYDGSHLNFVGINPEIKLRSHQVNAIAHIIYGGNTLLAHVVGAGKTFEVVAAAQESKRLGLCQKSMIAVPNHLTEQWATEYLQLYPSANILVVTKKDFEPKNRKKFCARIAASDIDAVIIGHSQLEKIPMSVERQKSILEEQMQEVVNGIADLKAHDGERFSIKQMEKTKKALEAKLKKLNDQSRKDDVVTFEELGVDRLFVDEAHSFKNLAAYTKMRNVAGISQTEAQKSSDLYMKCRYLDELTGGRGVIFATGTPISNSMVEMYTMQKYLQHDLLKEKELLHFDAWASTFGETVTAMELAPEGTGYRSKTRFARFYNLPELMTMFRDAADIQTADMLNLPVPKAEYHNIVLQPSEHQTEMVQTFAERAESVRNKQVDSSVDNMLLITNDGRKLALDQRLLNPILPESDTGKISACANNVFDIWQRTAEQKSTQMIFCDLSTPKNDGNFNVYDDLRDKLIAHGIPEKDIAYIHDANTEAKKKELFGKVNSGEVRILLGSTQKMGAGTNCRATRS